MKKNTNDNIKQKTEYLKLDLNNIPSFIKEFKTLDFRPSKFIDEKKYKLYKFLKVKDIQILLTPTNRLSEIKDKYRKSKTIKRIYNFK